MKKILLILSLFTILFTSCDRGDSIDTETSIFDDSVVKEKNQFDRWLDAYFVKPYNIRVIYDFVDIYSNYDYDLIPADFEKAKALTMAARYLWIEAYEEILDPAFFREFAPRILHFVGNPGWKSNNSVVVGEAEGGLRVSFFNVNTIVVKQASTYFRFMKTMHHEYAHIFQQKKVTDPAFDQITPGMYVSDNWTSGTEIDAWRGGCISKYATSSPVEDWVELYSIFVINTPEWWNNMLQSASTDANGNPVNGAKIIMEKFEIVYNYYKDNWNMDLYEMRAIVNRRISEIQNLNLDEVYNYDKYK